MSFTSTNTYCKCICPMCIAQLVAMLKCGAGTLHQNIQKGGSYSDS